jgi:hypothetical protein
MDSRDLGLIVVGIGVFITVIGLLIFSGAASWFGRLPGDIRIEGDNVKLFIPIASMLLVSSLASLLLALWRRLF